jgi:hypothetical protein
MSFMMEESEGLPAALIEANDGGGKHFGCRRLFNSPQNWK